MSRLLAPMNAEELMPAPVHAFNDSRDPIITLITRRRPATQLWRAFTGVKSNK